MCIDFNPHQMLIPRRKQRHNERETAHPIRDPSETDPSYGVTGLGCARKSVARSDRSCSANGTDVNYDICDVIMICNWIWTVFCPWSSTYESDSSVHVLTAQTEFAYEQKSRRHGTRTRRQRAPMVLLFRRGYSNQEDFLFSSLPAVTVTVVYDD
ncbi:hypothetical protein CBL_05551 [Carabus blaptoides fortunei]